MAESDDAEMVSFYIPEDDKFLLRMGGISIVHGHLDYALRYTIKTLTDVTAGEALDATEYEGSASLRKRIKELARKRLGEGPSLVRLQALMTRCERATAKRNILTHSFYAEHSDGVIKIQGADRAWKKLPSVDELDFITNEITTLVMEINHARLKGFLHEALKES